MLRKSLARTSSRSFSRIIGLELSDHSLDIDPYRSSLWAPLPPNFAGLAGFPGLALNNASFTYEDAIINLQAPIHLGLVSVTNVGVKGICTIGGAFDIPLGLAELPGYPGPGDTYRGNPGTVGIGN